MAYGFNIAPYLPGPEGLSGWQTLNAAISQVKQRRLQRELQTQAEAAAAQQNLLDRQARATEMDLARREAERIRQAGIERENTLGAASAAAKAMLAEQHGLPGEADAIMAAAGPTGVRAEPERLTPDVPTAPQLQAPPLRAPVGPRLQDTLQRAIAQEQGRLSANTQGQQINALGQDIGAMAGPPMPTSNVREFRNAQGALLGRTDRDEALQQRQARASALLAPGALSSNPLAAAAALRAQKAAVAAAAGGPVEDAVKAAEGTRADELGLLGKAATSEGINARFGMTDDRLVAKDQWASLRGPIVDEKVSTYLDARTQLEDAIQQAKGGNLSAMGALAMVAARTAQGSAQNLSDRDVASLRLGDVTDYLTKAQDFIERRLQGDKTVPPVGVGELIRYAQQALKAKEMQLARRLHASATQLNGIQWKRPEYREIAQEYITRVYSEYVTPEIEAELRRSDSAGAAPQTGRRSASVSVSRSRRGAPATDPGETDTPPPTEPEDDPDALMRKYGIQ